MKGRPKQSTLIIPPGDDPGGDTPFERFDNIIKRLLLASKQEIDRRMAKFARRKNPNGNADAFSGDIRRRGGNKS